MRTTRLRLLLCLFFGGILAVAGQQVMAEQEQDPLIVFAASSLAPALDNMAKAFEVETGRKIRLAYGSSAVLARQVANGAPADLYIGAHLDWIDFLIDQGFADMKETRLIAVNELVIAGPVGTGRTEQGQKEVRTLLIENPVTRIAVGATDSVPLGLYTKEALINLDLWDELRPRLAPAASARRALAFVASGSLYLGILFASDVASNDWVQVLARIPPHLHSPIRYIAVPLTADAAAFTTFLGGENARATLARHDFMPFETPK